MQGQIACPFFSKAVRSPYYAQHKQEIEQRINTSESAVV